MYTNKNFLKKTSAYYFIGTLGYIFANFIFSVSFYFTKIIVLSLIIQYTSIFIVKYILYNYFKIFDGFTLKKYSILYVMFFIFNNFYLNFITFKNIYFLQLSFTILTSLFGFLVMSKVMK